MKNILIVGTRFSPIPCVDGGAIEFLIDEYLKYNSKNQKYKFVVYSKFSEKVNDNILNKYNNVEFRFIKINTILYKITRLFCGILRNIFKNKIGDEFTRFMIKDLKFKNELNKYDDVIILNNINNIISVTKKIGGKHILYLHNDYLNIETSNSKNILNSLDEVWCVSEFVKNRVDEIDVLNNKTKVLYNGIQIEKFNCESCDEEIASKLKKEYNINENDFIVLYTGRVMKEKGVKELVEAFKNFQDKHDNVKLLVVGNNTDISKEYYNNLINDNKDNQNIKFLGRKTHEEIKYLQKISNVQVVPSMWNEAFGLTAVEGMAAGIPMIISKSGGLVEIAENGAAILVNRENIVNEIYEALEKIYINKDNFKENMVNIAKKRVMDFDMEKFYENFDNILAEE